MTRTSKRALGDLGEEIAARFLSERKFFIVDRNYLKKWGEIDIVARKKGAIHFIEVKTVSKGPTGGASGHRPEENVHTRKLDRLKRTIATYMMERGIDEESPWQIDVIVVTLDLEMKRATVKVLENIIVDQ